MNVLFGVEFFARRRFLMSFDDDGGHAASDPRPQRNALPKGGQNGRLSAAAINK